MESFVFVTDSQFGAVQSLLRYDTTSDSWYRFGRSEFYAEIAAGWDGRFYALRYSDSETVDKYDPMTLQLVGSVNLETPVDAIAASADGHIYGLSTVPSVIYRFSPSGAIEGSVDEDFVYAFDVTLKRHASPSELVPPVGGSPRRHWSRSRSFLPHRATRIPPTSPSPGWVTARIDSSSTDSKPAAPRCGARPRPSFTRHQPEGGGSTAIGLSL